MAERISPDSPEHKDQYQFVMRKRIVPWLVVKRNPYRKAFFERYEWVNEFAKDKAVLDVPCGMGWGTSLIHGASSLVGLDIDADAITEARRRYPGLDFRVGSMDSLDARAESVDVICCLEGIEHVPPETANNFLEEAFRSLKSNGHLLVSSPRMPDGSHSGNPYHVKEYPLTEILQLLEKRFRIATVNSKAVGNLIVDYIACQK